MSHLDRRREAEWSEAPGSHDVPETGEARGPQTTPGRGRPRPSACDEPACADDRDDEDRDDEDRDDEDREEGEGEEGEGEEGEGEGEGGAFGAGVEAGAEEAEDGASPPKVSRKVRRRRRRSRPRSKTIAMKRLTREELRVGALLYPPVDIPRPSSRCNCSHDERPCPWVACKYHLYLDVNPETGSIKINFPDLEPWELSETCALDVADRGGITLEEVGEIMNLTRERIRQVEVRGLLKLRMSSPSPEEIGNGEVGDE